MHEENPQKRRLHRALRENEFRIHKRQRLRARDPSVDGHRSDHHHRHNRRQTRPHQRHHRQREHHRRKRTDGVQKEHDGVVQPSRAEGGGHSEEHSEEERAADRGQGDQQRDAGADDGAREGVASELIGAEEVRGRRPLHAVADIEVGVSVGRDEVGEDRDQHEQQDDAEAERSEGVAEDQLEVAADDGEARGFRHLSERRADARVQHRVHEVGDRRGDHEDHA